MYKKDDIYFGMGLAAIAPIVVFLVFFFLIWLIVSIFGIYPFLQGSSLAILSIAVNFLLIRYYFSGKAMHETGKGILIITVAYVLLFFLFKGIWMQLHLPGLKFS